MSKINLDLNKLLGFKIIASEVASTQRVVIGAKLGQKEGLKDGGALAKIGVKVGSKLGSKVGEKNN